MFTPKGQEEDNLTGGQIQQVLDTLIYSALRPVVEASSLFDVQITYLLTTATLNRKRKISALPREEFLTMLCNAIAAKTAEEKIDIISRCKIERNIPMTFIQRFLEAAGDYESTYSAALSHPQKHERLRHRMRKRVIERELQANPKKLYPAIQSARDFLEQAYAFRNSIVERYVLQAMKKVRSYRDGKGSDSKRENIDIQCAHQNVMTGVTKAIDKYDSSKGALTSYVDFWAFNAMTAPSPEHGHEYGIAYTIPSTQRRAIAQGKSETVNFSHSLDFCAENDDRPVAESLMTEHPAEEDLEQEANIKALRVMAKLADRGGIGRYWLNIEEVFSKAEKTEMRRIMKDQGTMTKEKP